MSVKEMPQDTVTTKLIARWEQASGKLVALARELPETKYAYRPVDSVRTFGDVLRHIAFWNQYVAETIEGKNPDGNANELPESDYRAKAKIIDAIEKTSADVVSALRASQGRAGSETVETVATFIEHTSEHYGQLVVYARLNGVIPPTSRS